MTSHIVDAIRAVYAATAIYTAPTVVREMLTTVGWPTGDTRLLDPSCGDGSVLVEALHMLAPAPGDWRAVSRVTGFEFMPSAAVEARARITSVLLGLGWDVREAHRASRGMVHVCDFLVVHYMLGRYDLIVGNPPYLRFARLPEYFKTLYPSVVPALAMGDLAHAFLDACSRHLAPGGKMAMITADRWLLNDGAAKLRSSLGELLTVTDIVRVDPATSFYRPKDRRRGTPPRVHPVRVILEAGRGGQPIGSAPISPDGVPAHPGGPTLGDLASIKIAPWLGPNGIFVLPAEWAGRFPAGVTVPAVDTDDIIGGDELGTPKRVALLTTREAPHASVLEHLRGETARLSERGRRSPFWLPPETITVDTSLPSLLVPRIARAVRAIDVPPGVLPINHNLTVVSAGSSSLEEIKAILLHPDTQAWVAAHALRLENGFISITTKLLRRIPLPGGHS